MILARYIIDNYNVYKNTNYDFGKFIEVTTWSYKKENTILKTLLYTYNLAIIGKKDSEIIYNFNTNEIIVKIKKINDTTFFIEQITDFSKISTTVDSNNIFFNSFLGFYNIKQKK